VSTPTKPVFVEVTNTLSVAHLTGIQRLTRELLAHLPGEGDGEPVTFTPIVWEGSHLKYRRLTDEESERLAITPSPPARSRGRLDLIPSPVARGLRMGIRQVRRLQGRQPSAERAHLIVDPLPEGSIWLDLEAAWHGPVPRAELLPKLWATGVPTAVMIPDVMPVLRPDWFEDRMARRFARYVDAHLNRSGLVLCISEQTERDVHAIGSQMAPGRELRTAVAPMGADHRRSEGSATIPGELVGRPYLIYVATLEPRKNHGVLIDLLDRLVTTHPDVAVVFVGKAGWKVEELEARIEQHPRRGTNLLWYQRVDDVTLDALYRFATLAVVPSYYEGFGIPVVEALSRGVPVVSSDGGALPETGGDLADYVEPDDLDGWTTVVTRHLDDADFHLAARERLLGYEPPKWDECARVVVERVATLG
jgi:glycosyltransferase involved in cell wall biosynthesis